MNFLAHAVLSFNDPFVLAGNLISDFVKGKQQFLYPQAIRHGIVLHRAIDNYTDCHPMIREMKSFFKPDYRLYAGALVDVACDHFLANDEREFGSGKDLLNFTEDCYAQLNSLQDQLPDDFVLVFQSMRTHNWLYNYRFERGLEQSFRGLSRRSKYLKETATAFRIVNEQRDELNKLYREFFPQLKAFSFKTLTELRAEL